MKTAMQELHDKWGNEKEWSWEKIESWFKEAKEKEKEQIIDAYNQGALDGESSMLEYPNYYNQNYGE